MDPKTSNLTEKTRIRYHFDEKSNTWQFSIVDVIAMTTKSTDPRNYWKVLKNRLKKERNQLVTHINQLKMKSSDGKFYLTDAGDAKILLEILKLISPTHVLPFRLWFDEMEQKNEKIGQDSLSATKANTESYPQEKFNLLINGFMKNNLIIIQAFVAGVEIEDLIVSITTKNVIIKGERKMKENISLENYSMQELLWGKFSRVIELPVEIEIDQALVTEKNGLLTLELPIIDKNRSRLLKIKSE